MRAYVCGVPPQFCGGSRVTVNAMMSPKTTAHGSPAEAFNCHARYLVNQCDYEQIGPREFKPKSGGPIRVLTKKSKFGAMLRGGKRGGEAQSTSRYNAACGPGRSNKSGVIGSF